MIALKILNYCHNKNSLSIAAKTGLQSYFIEHLFITEIIDQNTRIISYYPPLSVKNIIINSFKNIGPRGPEKYRKTSILNDSPFI